MAIDCTLCHFFFNSFEFQIQFRGPGLGQHKTGKLNNMNLSFSLAPRNTEVLIPVYHSSAGYAFLWNLPSLGSVSLNHTGTYWTADAVIQADFWVSTTSGANESTSPWAQLQRHYADATGHAPVFPHWSSGYWQCKNRYRNQSQV